MFPAVTICPGCGRAWCSRSIESLARAPQGIQRERARHIRRVHENLRETQREKPDRKHRLGAVHEREAFLGFQH